MSLAADLGAAHPDSSGDDLALLGVAVGAALEATRVIAGLRNASLDVGSKSTPTDLVTALDRASEASIGAHISRHRPDDALMGEEGLSREGSSGVEWVIDPLDGTVNVVYGQPAWAISIAATVGGEGVAGVVLAPVLGEAFTATRGSGAVRWAIDDGALVAPNRLRVSQCTSLDLALLATGFAYDLPRRTRHAAAIASLLTQVRDIRRLGAAALDLCFVAAGRVDAYVEEALMPWDLAAGGLIAREAGADVQVMHADGPGVGLVIASSPGITTALVDAVRHARSD